MKNREKYIIKKISREVIRVEILSQAGKATGKYSQVYNVHNLSDGSKSWIDLREFELEEVTNREVKMKKVLLQEMRKEKERLKELVWFLGRGR